MRLRELLSEGVERLAQVHIEEADTDAWILFSYVTGYDRGRYYTDMENAAGPELQQTYRGLIARRAKYEPVQYITGQAPFMGLDFTVTPDVLIPRFDTEILVGETLNRIRQREKMSANILDLCTGSGCILISLLNALPHATGTGGDISEAALCVAKKNADRILKDRSVAFVQSDLYEHISGKYDIITSNPPYIPTNVIETLSVEVREHEPRLALDGTKDGLFFYRRIIADVNTHLEDDGILVLEIGYDQAEAACALLAAQGLESTVIRDMAGHDRVVIGGRHV